MASSPISQEGKLKMGDAIPCFLMPPNRKAESISREGSIEKLGGIKKF
jgi:hypothetical protein